MQMYYLVIPNNVPFFCSYFFAKESKLYILKQKNNVVLVKVTSLYLKEEEKIQFDDRRVDGQHLCHQILSLFSLTFEAIPPLWIHP